jgi:hypothetical protein
MVFGAYDGAVNILCKIIHSNNEDGHLISL